MYFLTQGDYIKATPHTLALVNRSILLEMGIKDEELPPISEEDAKQARGLPRDPVCLENLHRIHRDKNKHNETCFWRDMGRTEGLVPKLDRYMFSLRRIETLVVHDPDRVNVPGRFTKSKEDDSIRYRQQDATRIGVPWVESPPAKNPMVAHLHLHRSERIGDGNAGEVFRATLDLPFVLADELF